VVFTSAAWYNKSMNSSKVINVDENSPEFLLDLERRIKLAKNPKNRIPLSIAKKDILKNIRSLRVQKYSVNLTSDAENDIAELMAFYAELVDDESATRFFDEAMETVANLQNMPRTNAVFKDDPDVRKVQMKNHKVAIVYLVDNNRFEVIAVRAYHQMQNPTQYQESVRERIRKLHGQV
jgi:plasmid stabilization system protein ParE